MKRFILILALVLMVATPMMAERVTPETARKVAATFLSNNGAKAAQLTDLSKAAGFSNLYIFTAEQGFVVMAADDCVKPILGYSLTGNFITEDMPENVRGWLQGYNDEIQYAIDNQMRASSETAKLWKDLIEGHSKAGKTTAVVAPLIQTKWNQNKYYNSLCPEVSDGPDGHAFTGCVATAMAQIMKYYNYPSTGNGSNSYTWNSQTLSANFGETVYDWNNMGYYYEYYYPNPISGTATWLDESYHTAEKVEAVATLMYHCGVSINMNYGGQSTGGSNASTSEVVNALKTYFNYCPSISYEQKDFYSNNDWINMIKAELDENRPLQYRGNTGNGSGHSFVCDGYDSNNYFHFNWGWAGSLDGYFSLDNLNTGANTQSGAGNGNYTNNQAAIFGIEPISSLAAPTLSATATNSSIILSWTDVAEASYYDVYRDNVKILTNVTELTYTDNEVTSGVFYKYYVRAVSVTGLRSNPSNSVTKSFFSRDYKPTNLSATLSDNDAILVWNSPENKSTDLHYGTTSNGYRYGMGEKQDTYWAETFSAARLSDYAGLLIQKVSAYLYLPGDYTLYLYEGDLSNNEANKIYEQTFTNSSAGWKDINITSSIVLDHTKDLWVIMYYPYQEGAPQDYTYPAPIGNYDEIPYDDTTNPECYNPRWIGPSLDLWYYVGNNISWLFRTYLSDGTFTYNLYDNGTSVAEDIPDTSYTMTHPDDNMAHQYTVKTNYYGGESEASNMAGLALGTASLNSLEMNADDKMTVTRGSTLSVSGTLSNANPDNLILENGSQLINNSEGVKATMKKSIAAYATDKDGWNLIASPFIESFEPTDTNGLLTNIYDLYMFDQSEEKEWRNYKANSFATIDHKKGYLYANSDETTLTFTGTLANIATATPLAYNDNVGFKGFNLIGNPFPCEAYIDRSFYVLKEDGSDFTVGSNPIPPCAAILVQAQNASDNSVTFSKTASKTDSSIIAQLKTADIKDSNIIDQARVNFNENDNLVKYSFDNNASSLYFPHESNNFAAVSFAGQSEMPLNFNVKHNGSYTLSFEMENADVDYLHLIDNMTGEDIDLLTNKSYTFEATTNDYASRFRLVFAHEDGPSTSSGAFAFVSNGEIVINQEGTLQIVDMTGRMVASRNGRIQSVPTTGMTSGVYVLRLINGDNVKTQKIVIE